MSLRAFGRLACRLRQAGCQGRVLVVQVSDTGGYTSQARGQLAAEESRLSCACWRGQRRKRTSWPWWRRITSERSRFNNKNGACCLSVCLLHKEDHEQEKDRVLAGRVSLGHSLKAPPVVGIRSHFARPRSPATPRIHNPCILVVQDGDWGFDMCSRGRIWKKKIDQI